MTKPPPPVLNTDEEAEAFVDTADLTQFDLSGFIPTRYECIHPAKAVGGC